jgi:hypothetical protein
MAWQSGNACVKRVVVLVVVPETAAAAAERETTPRYRPSFRLHCPSYRYTENVDAVDPFVRAPQNKTNHQETKV